MASTRLRTLLQPLLAVIGGSAIVAGCRQIVGVDDRAVDSGPACGIAWSDAACQRCAETRCCAQAAACADVPACYAVESCLAACDGDSTCRSRCRLENRVASGHELPAALDVCLASQCSEDCGLTCGALSVIAPPDAAAPCEACLSRNYCDVTSSCAASLDCQRYVSCRLNCVTGDCIGACAAEDGTDGRVCRKSCGANSCLRPCETGDDSGVVLYSEVFESAAGQNCKKDCAAGNNWSCVGAVEWPIAQHTSRELSAAFVDADTGEPLSGVAVKMCNGSDEDCRSPLSEATTDSEGIVHLVDLSSAVNGQGYGANGYFELSSPRLLYPTRVYWGFPLSQAEGVLGTPIPVFASGTGLPLDPALGALAVLALDCLGNQASEVSFSSVGGVAPCYVDGGALNCDRGSTGERGTAVFFDVPPGTVTVTATPEALGRVSSRVTLVVRRGYLTELSMAPTP